MSERSRTCPTCGTPILRTDPPTECRLCAWVREGENMPGPFSDNYPDGAEGYPFDDDGFGRDEGYAEEQERRDDERRESEARSRRDALDDWAEGRVARDEFADSVANADLRELIEVSFTSFWDSRPKGFDVQTVDQFRSVAFSLPSSEQPEQQSKLVMKFVRTLMAFGFDVGFTLMCERHRQTCGELFAEITRRSEEAGKIVADVLQHKIEVRLDALASQDMSDKEHENAKRASDD